MDPDEPSEDGVLVQPFECDHIDLQNEAELIVRNLRANGFSVEQAILRQWLSLIEEVGEFAGAYRRAQGMARRTGPEEDVELEAADVIITMYVTAHELGIDLSQAIERKLKIINTRGWREL